MNHYDPKFSNPDIHVFEDDGFGHIRLQYNIPILRGVRVKFEGNWGTITTHFYGHVIIKPDYRTYKYERWQCHPTWHLEYFPTPAQAAESKARRRAFWAIAYPKKPYPEPEVVTV